MIDDPRNKPPRRKNPTFAISILIVVVVLLVIGTLFFNAIREKRDYDSQNTQTPTSAAKLASPSGGASQ
jgi:hypothetical protein